jgi:hypothetical protein
MTAHRNVVEEDRFVGELAAIDADVHRTDAALEYVKECSPANPDAGLTTSVPGIMVAPLIRLTGLLRKKPRSCGIFLGRGARNS